MKAVISYYIFQVRSQFRLVMGKLFQEAVYMRHWLIINTTKNIRGNFTLIVHQPLLLQNSYKLGEVVWFNGISTLEGYLMPNSVYTSDLLANSLLGTLFLNELELAQSAGAVEYTD